jgi:hypothetical protein
MAMNPFPFAAAQFFRAVLDEQDRELEVDRREALIARID